MKKGDVLEVWEVSENEILDEVILHKRFNSEWLKSYLVNRVPGIDIKENKTERFWFWLLNDSVVGFSHITGLGDPEAKISFQVKDDLHLSEDTLQRFIEKTILSSFETYQLEKVFYDCGENCATPISRTFLQHFEPHPIGWVHLNDGKFVLTRGQIDRTEKEFYKI